MTREEIIEMFIDWAYRRDEKIRMSDWMCECFEAGLDLDEIEAAGHARVKELREKLLMC